MAELFNPPGLPPPGSGTYHHVARVQAGSEMFFFAGQVGNRLDGTLAETIEEQTACVFTNIRVILEDMGLTPASLIKLTIYLTDREHRLVMHEARGRILSGAKPPSTVLVVKGLGRPQVLIEVDAIAAR
jgi:2-iminobutanoate/2-iminopropanoate deaminase